MKKEHIIQQMQVLPEIDPDYEIARRIAFIQRQLQSTGLTTLVLGISGGIDSCALGRLAQLAVNQLNQQQSRVYRFVAVRLPYDVQADEADCQASIDFIQPSACLCVNVQAATDAAHQQTCASLQAQGLLPDDPYKVDFVKGNVKARSRMLIQYEIAGMLDALVLGSDHSAENLTGFFTKHGDGACDLAPLFGLNKRQIRQISRHLGAPEQVINKAPTADLESLNPQKSDEQALGVSYDCIDDFLEGKPVSQQVCDTLIDMFIKTQHKRMPVPTIYNE